MPAPRDLAQTLAIQFNYTNWTFTKTIADVTHEESLAQPATAGNCPNWVAGHIAATRQTLLEVLGQEPVWGQEPRARYRRGAAAVADNDDAESFDQIKQAFTAAQDRIMAGLQTLTEERLEEPAPFSPGNDENETVGSLLAGLAFHESYHVGQLGVLRRLPGKDSIIK